MMSIIYLARDGCLSGFPLTKTKFYPQNYYSVKENDRQDFGGFESSKILTPNPPKGFCIINALISYYNP